MSAPGAGEWGVVFSGGCLLQGEGVVSALGGGVSAPGGSCPGGSAPKGRGGLLGGVCSQGWWYPSMH